ncbi:hypothetical protein AA309_13150 [Microvirga vignae]|uniref:Peptidase A2 domain-containing protein n=1 Tax=Microvirga vignae TaxID=1225564 RepID=A0A0H1RJ45_9HYPH|nr:TIGR02281 family clan AA aspartic protease [Microvirga vignae]KLK92637.1 hypothetical protein AA309_13150 [Microvirga vignae]
MIRRYPLLVIALVSLGRSAPAIATEASTLTPRIGETVQEFEARRRGVKFTRADDNPVTVDADPRGHFYLQPTLDGQPVRMVVDTGASVVALTYEDAERVGARLSPGDFTIRISTANGVVEGAPFRISEIKIRELIVRDVEAIVLPKGRLEVSLLGMSFLRRLSGFDISQGRLNLRN